MSNILKNLQERGLINCPDYVVDQCQYLAIMGSEAYGAASAESDRDIYGWCIPDKRIIFPHQVAGDIEGFGNKSERFECWQQHHINDTTARGGRGIEYDCQVYSIVKFFDLIMNNNPNMIDSLFVPQRCILHMTSVATIVREKRKMFLHKGSWHRFKGYAFQQMHKLALKNPQGNRREIVQEYGYDVKYALHLVRLLNEIEQILVEHDLDLERNSAQLRAIRKGEMFSTVDNVIDYFNRKERELETLYTNSTLPWGPDEVAVKELLLNCLEQHFGSLEKVVHREDRYEMAIRDIKSIVNRLE